MKKVLTLLLAALFVCMVMPMQGAFAETVEEKLATDQSLWEMYRLNNPEGAVQIEYGANTMALKRAGATYAMQYKKEQTDAIYKFKVKFENPVTPFGDENFVDFCIRDTAPGSACWHNNDNCYALRLRSIPGTSELKAQFTRNNSGSNNTPIGQIYDLTGANALEFGRYYEFEIGVVNNQDGNVELTFSIDGVQILKTVDDSDNKITGAGYFTIYSAAKTDVVIMEVDEGEPGQDPVEEKLDTDQSQWTLNEFWNGSGSVNVQYSGNQIILNKAAQPYIMKYNIQLTDAKYKFFLKFDNLISNPHNEFLFDICFRDTTPDKAFFWDSDDISYGLRFCIRQEGGFKAFFARKNNGDKGIGQVFDFIGDNALEYGKFYLFEIGAVNEGSGVRLTLSVDGEEVLSVLDTDAERITGSGYFTITNMEKVDLTIMEADGEPTEPTTTEEPTEPTTTEEPTGPTTTEEPTDPTTTEEPTEPTEESTTTTSDTTTQPTDPTTDSTTQDSGDKGPATGEDNLLTAFVLVMALTASFLSLMLHKKRKACNTSL